MLSQNQLKNYNISTVVAAALVGRPNEVMYCTELNEHFYYVIDVAATANGTTVLSALGVNAFWKLVGAVPSGTGAQDNLTAIVDPALTDDINAGYTVGSKWYNTATREMFICIRNTASATLWRAITDNKLNGEAQAELRLKTLTFTPNLVDGLNYKLTAGLVPVSVSNPATDVRTNIGTVLRVALDGGVGGTVTFGSLYLESNLEPVVSLTLAASQRVVYTFAATEVGGIMYMVRREPVASTGKTVSIIATKAAHGYTAPSVVYLLNGVWEGAVGDGTGKDVQGVVTRIIDGSTFVVTLYGAVHHKAHGFALNSHWFVSSVTPFGIVSAKPASGTYQRILSPIDADNYIVDIGEVMPIGSGGGATLAIGTPVATGDTFIDGKPIYKTFIDLGATTSGTTIFPEANFSTVLSITGKIQWSNNWATLNSGIGATDYSTAIHIVGLGINLYLSGVAATPTAGAFAIVEHTI